MTPPPSAPLATRLQNLSRGHVRRDPVLGSVRTDARSRHTEAPRTPSTIFFDTPYPTPFLSRNKQDVRRHTNTIGQTHWNCVCRLNGRTHYTAPGPLMKINDLTLTKPAPVDR